MHSPNPNLAAPNRRFFLASSACTALLGLSGVPGLSHAAVSDTLVFGLSSFPNSLSPFQNTGAAAGTVKLQVHRGLLDYDAKGQLRPAIAKSFSQESPKVWSFMLRDNAKFHNGDPVTAEDVRFSIGKIVEDKSTAYLKPDFLNVERVEVVTPRHVRIHLKEASAVFGYKLASWSAPVISAKSTEAEPIGCGPFRIERIERGTRIDLVRFDGYYRPGNPKLRRLQFVAYVDENLRMAALESGDIHLTDFVPYPSMAALKSNKSLQLSAVDGPFMYMVFNTTKAPFNDARVRNAVAIAINRQDIVQAAFSGQGSPLETIPFPKGGDFADPANARHWKRDVARARALLQEAGVGKGFSANLLSTGQYAMHEQTALVIQQNLQEIGVQVQLKLPDWGTRVTQGRQGAYDMAVMGLAGEYNDPDSLSAYFTGTQPAHTRSFGYSNARLTELFALGRAETDPAKRRAVYRELEKLALAEAPMVGLAWRQQAYAMQASVRGFNNLPAFLTLYSALSLEDVTLA